MVSVGFSAPRLAATRFETHPTLETSPLSRFSPPVISASSVPDGHQLTFYNQLFDRQLQVSQAAAEVRTARDVQKLHLLIRALQEDFPYSSRQIRSGRNC